MAKSLAGRWCTHTSVPGACPRIGSGMGSSSIEAPVAFSQDAGSGQNYGGMGIRPLLKAR